MIQALILNKGSTFERVKTKKHVLGMLILDFYLSLLQIALRQNAFWIGASDYTIEGQFRWLETGFPIGNFSAWGPGKPSQNDTNNCVRMFYNGVEYKWEDVDCNDRTTNYICEKPYVHVHHA